MGVATTSRGTDIPSDRSEISHGTDPSSEGALPRPVRAQLESAWEATVLARWQVTRRLAAVTCPSSRTMPGTRTGGETIQPRAQSLPDAYGDSGSRQSQVRKAQSGWSVPSIHSSRSGMRAKYCFSSPLALRATGDRRRSSHLSDVTPGRLLAPGRGSGEDYEQGCTISGIVTNWYPWARSSGITRSRAPPVDASLFAASRCSSTMLPSSTLSMIRS